MISQFLRWKKCVTMLLEKKKIELLNLVFKTSFSFRKKQ